MPVEEVEVSQVEAPPVVSIEVPADRLDDLAKAVQDQHGHEQVEFFVNQNPATERMMETVQDAYDAMSESLARQVSDALR